MNKSLAIAEMAAQYCTSRIVAPFFNALYSIISEHITIIQQRVDSLGYIFDLTKLNDWSFILIKIQALQIEQGNVSTFSPLVNSCRNDRHTS